MSRGEKRKETILVLGVKWTALQIQIININWNIFFKKRIRRIVIHNSIFSDKSIIFVSVPADIEMFSFSAHQLTHTYTTFIQSNPGSNLLVYKRQTSSLAQENKIKTIRGR